MVDIEKLKGLAEDVVKSGENWIAAGMLRQLFASSATPELVLELIAEVERMRSIESFEDAVACVFDNLKFCAANTDDKDFDERLEDLADEVIEYAPRYKKQWKDILGLMAERDHFKAENEALRKNANRYEWLRNEHTHPGCLSSDPDKAKWLDEYLMCGDKLDAAIDEQLAKVKP